MKRIVIVGAGGHGKVVADICLQMRDAACEVEPVAFVDAEPALHGTSRLGLPVLGWLDALGSFPHDGVVLGIGDNAQRARVWEQVLAAGKRPVSAIHPTAVLAPDVVVGRGVVVCAGVVVNCCTTV